MKVTLTHDGKSVELDLTAEQMKALGLEEEKKTGYERAEKGDTYATEDACGYQHAITETNCGSDDDIYENALYYANFALGEANRRADRLMRKIRRFAAENGGIPSVKDWEKIKTEDYERHWYITYDYNRDALTIDYETIGRGHGTVHFNNPHKAKEAIELFYYELIWYFTEYEAMLR